MNTLIPDHSSQRITKFYGNEVFELPHKGRNFAAQLWWEGEPAALPLSDSESAFAIIHSFLATARHVCK
jgi:hypothetical protein